MSDAEQSEKEQLKTSLDSGGQLFAGKYRLVELLGKGGMSSVYKAEHVMVQKTFAIKLMHDKYADDPKALLRFKQEAAAACKLSHPNIIAVHDFDVADGQPFQAMDYLKGHSLSDAISQSKGLPLERALHIWLQICDALAHAHEHGVVHRDLKPSNVMLINNAGDADFVKIVDFGIAKILPQGDQAAQHLTQTGDVFGSPLYMSPEQCNGDKLDQRTDIYSMGCLMFECLVGEPPFMGSTILATIHMQLEAMPRSVAGTIGEAETASRLDFVLSKAMAKDRGQRYQSMQQLADDLRAIQSGRQRNWLLRASQGLSLARARLDRSWRQPGFRLVASLSIALCTAAALVIAVFPLLPIPLPEFATTPWPLYAAEFADQKKRPLTNLDTLMLQNLEERTELPLDAQTKQHLSDPAAQESVRAAAISRRDAALIRASHGQYEEGARDAASLHWLLTRLTGGADSLVDQASSDHTRDLLDYARIGDSCYFAPSTPQQTNAGIYFYSLALQWAPAAPNLQSHLRMKIADLQLRASPPQTSAALDLLLKVNPAQLTEPRDRAVYFSRLADAAADLKQWDRAANAYATSAQEWANVSAADLPIPNLVAQSKYLGAQCAFAQAMSSKSTGALTAAENNLHGAIKLYNSMTPLHHAPLAALYSRLGDVERSKGDWLGAGKSAWLAKWEALQEPK